MCSSPATATATAYAAQRAGPGRRSARSSSQVAALTASTTKAYERASVP